MAIIIMSYMAIITISYMAISKFLLIARLKCLIIIGSSQFGCMHEVLHEVLVKALCVAESACLRLEYQTGLLKYDTISIPYMAIIP